MERSGSVVIICGVLGLISAATGFGAEATRIKGSEVELVTPTQCAYPRGRSPALALGLIAVASLLIAHIIVNVATAACCFCFQNIFTNFLNCRALIACFILSWLTFILGLFLLLTAAVLNERHGEDTDGNYNYYYCYIVKPGMFAGGAVLSLTSILLGIIFFYYLSLFSSNNNTISMAVAMAPQPHETNRDHPLFVHEDTYMRRQFP